VSVSRGLGVCVVLDQVKVQMQELVVDRSSQVVEVLCCGERRVEVVFADCAQSALV